MGLHGQKLKREAVLDTIGAGIAPHIRCYARVQERVLGLDRAHVADIDAS